MDDSASYSWIDISSGTELFLADNGYTQTDLPYNFTYYDVGYITIYISSNGYLSFIDTTPGDTSGTIPRKNPVKFRYSVAPYWTDLDPSIGAGHIYIANYTSTTWIISWVDVNITAGGIAGSFQVILKQNGDIIFNYDYLANVGSYTCGLNYGVDDTIYNIYTGLTSATDNLAIQFTQQPNGGNGGGGGGGGLPPDPDDDGAAAIIAGSVVTFIIIGAVAGISGFYYHKDPEKFRTNMKKAREKLIEKGGVFKEKMKSGGSKLKKKLVAGGAVIKEKAGNTKNKLKEKINKETLQDFGRKLRDKDRTKDKLVASKGKPKDSGKKLGDKKE